MWGKMAWKKYLEKDLGGLYPGIGGVIDFAM